MCTLFRCVDQKQWVLQATKRGAEVAEGMPRLRGFVHVSTAYVNAHQPRGNHIEEDIYPLYLRDGQAIRHDSLAAELAALPHAKAERKVGTSTPQVLLQLVSHLSTCTLYKIVDVNLKCGTGMCKQILMIFLIIFSASRARETVF